MSLRARMTEKGLRQAQEERNDPNRFRPELDRSLRTIRSARRAQPNHHELSFKNKLKVLGLKHNKCFRIGKLAQCEGAREENEETEERMAFCEKCVVSCKVVQDSEGTVVDRLYRAHLADVQVMSFGEDSKEKSSKLQALLTQANQIKVRNLKYDAPLTEVEEIVLVQYDLINEILNRPSVPLLEDDNEQRAPAHQRQRIRLPIPAVFVNENDQSDRMEVDSSIPASDSDLDSDTVSVSTTHSIRNGMSSLSSD